MVDEAWRQNTALPHIVDETELRNTAALSFVLKQDAKARRRGIRLMKQNYETRRYGPLS